MGAKNDYKRIWQSISCVCCEGIRWILGHPAEQTLNAAHNPQRAHWVYRLKTQDKEGCDVVKLTDPV